MYLARKALEPYKEYVKTSVFNDGEFKRDCIYPIDSSPYPASSFKIRFDFEIDGRDIDVFEYFRNDNPLPNQHVENMFDQMEFDLENLIIFSDTEAEDEYGWKNPFDGVIKRKRVPVEINLLAARTYREFKTMKDWIELTTYIRLDIEWDE